MKLLSKRSLALAIALMLVVAMVVPAAAMAATTLKLSGSTTVYPGAVILAKEYKRRTGVNVVVTGGGSGTGISQVLAGSVNIGMSSRDLKQSEIDKGAKATKIARDGLVVIVNKRNPKTNLTESQIRDMYQGKITNWKQVGGPNARIVLCGRTGASGTYEYFKEVFLLGKRQSSKTKQYSSNGMVRSAVRNNKYAIGYVGQAYMNSTIKTLKIGGVYPTRTTASNGKYKYVRPLYFVTKGSASGATKSFINWTLSRTGQTYISKEFLPAK
jgi:phosphate transport system substrate-binding protein